ncbi:MAG: hypothetical protein B7733_17330 [Myxococcales bacterium FL481]|nr:MAG: hypothetical protein B7733_17330 [Myxococcales bacterium FL481]
MPHDHRYSDEEVVRIMQRAAEMQAEHGSERRLSIAEVEAVAREAGIDKALVRRAAAELSVTGRGHGDAPSGFLGAARRIEMESAISGEIDSGEVERFVEVVRRALGETGEIKTVGRTLTWETSPGSSEGITGKRRVVLTLIPRDGVTRVRLEEDLTSLASEVFGAGFAAVFCGVLVIFVVLANAGVVIPGFAPLLSVTWVGSGYALLRMGYRRSVRRRQARLRALLRQLVSLPAGPDSMQDASGSHAGFGPP